MGNKHKAKGTAFETLVVNYLKDNGFTDAHRTALQGINDSGDIHGITRSNTPAELALQCKNQKAFDLSGWLNDTVEQASKLDNGVPLLVVKRPGKGEKALGDSYAIMRLSDIIAILKDAGFC